MIVVFLDLVDSPRKTTGSGGFMIPMHAFIYDTAVELLC